jgi:hypothetical protein
VDPQEFGAGTGLPAWPPPVPWLQAPPAPARPRRSRARILAAVVIVLAALGVGLLGYAATGGRPAVDQGAGKGSGAAAADVAARAVWRTAPADELFAPTLSSEGTEEYYRLAIDQDESCAQLPAAFLRALAPAGCVRLIQATYLDSTESVVATVGLVVTGGTAAQRGALEQSWAGDSYARQYAMMPSTYPVRASLAARFQNPQRIAWMSAVSGSGTYLAFTVAGFVDARSGPDAAQLAQGTDSELGSDSPPVAVAAELPSEILGTLDAEAKSEGGGAP